MSKGVAKRIRVGIIGANPDRGWATQAHIPALKSLSDDFEIMALSTTRRESADVAGKLFGVLDSDGSCGLVEPGDISGLDALLGPLSANGGLTETHALLSASPAIDAADNSACPATDQPGVLQMSGLQACGNVGSIGPFDLRHTGTCLSGVGVFQTGNSLH